MELHFTHIMRDYIRTYPVIRTDDGSVDPPWIFTLAATHWFFSTPDEAFSFAKLLNDTGGLGTWAADPPAWWHLNVEYYVGQLNGTFVQNLVSPGQVYRECPRGLGVNSVTEK